MHLCVGALRAMAAQVQITIRNCSPYGALEVMTSVQKDQEGVGCIRDDWHMVTKWGILSQSSITIMKEAIMQL